VYILAAMTTLHVVPVPALLLVNTATPGLACKASLVHLSSRPSRMGEGRSQRCKHGIIALIACAGGLRSLVWKRGGPAARGSAVRGPHPHPGGRESRPGRVQLREHAPACQVRFLSSPSTAHAHVPWWHAASSFRCIGIAAGWETSSAARALCREGSVN
jgi:hypothetical protein